MSDERLEAARAEAKRRSPRDPDGYSTSEVRGEFLEGVRWADSNPAPRTITREELEEFKVAWHDADKRGRAGSRVAAGLRAIGIEVEDER